MTRAAQQLAALLVSAWMSPGAMFAHLRTGPEGFSINLPVPYARLRDVMREVCGDGIVHGTSQYQQETGISGATAVAESKSFPRWQGVGEVCYKLRPQAIAPAHFVASNDVGTITVRYIVEPLGSAQAHISIDAVFVEDGHRRRHPSKGLVETSEFREVALRLKALVDAEGAATAEAQRREQQAVRAQQQARQKELLATLAALKIRLDAATATVEQLQKRAQAIRRRVSARVQPPAAELKAFPFSQAPTIQLLEAGQPCASSSAQPTGTACGLRTGARVGSITS